MTGRLELILVQLVSLESKLILQGQDRFESKLILEGTHVCGQKHGTSAKYTAIPCVLIGQGTRRYERSQKRVLLVNHVIDTRLLIHLESDQAGTQSYA